MNMTVITNINDVQINKKQAEFFAIQIFSGMKEYISSHKKEFEQWEIQQKGTQKNENS